MTKETPAQYAAWCAAFKRVYPHESAEHIASRVQGDLRAWPNDTPEQRTARLDKMRTFETPATKAAAATPKPAAAPVPKGAPTMANRVTDLLPEYQAAFPKERTENLHAVIRNDLIAYPNETDKQRATRLIDLAKSGLPKLPA